MAEDTPPGRTEDLSRNPDEGGRAATLVEIELPIERPASDGLEETVAAEMLELEHEATGSQSMTSEGTSREEGTLDEGAPPGVSEEKPSPEEVLPKEPVLEEVVETSTKLPWWRRIFAFVRHPWDGVTADVVSPEEAALSVGAPSPKAPPISYSRLPTSTYTPDDVRALIREELAHAQDDLARLVQVELAREQEERRRFSLDDVQKAAQSVYAARAESLQMEVEALREAERRTLQDHDRPLRERMEEVDYIRECIAKAEQGSAELEDAAAQRAAEAADVLAELEGRGAVTKPRHQFGSLTAQWSMLLALALVAAVSVAGVLLPRSSRMHPELALEMAVMYGAADRSEDAIRLLDQVAESGPRDVETLSLLGDTYLALKQYEQAVEHHQRVVQASGGEAEYRLKLAQTYWKAGQLSEAEQEFQRLVDQNPDHALDYYLALADIYYEVKDYQAALTQYRKIIEAGIATEDVYLHVGEIHWKEGDFDEAFPNYEQAVQIDPNNYVAHLRMADIYQRDGEVLKAIDGYRIAVQLRPDVPWGHLGLASAHLALEQYEQAAEEYQAAVEIEPSADAYVSLGQAYLGMGDCEQALVQFNRALGLDPANDAAAEGLSACQQANEPAGQGQ